MIVAIDGPSGAGKSTVAKAAAKRLGFSCLDTGAMCRAIAWEGARRRRFLRRRRGARRDRARQRNRVRTCRGRPRSPSCLHLGHGSDRCHPHVRNRPRRGASCRRSRSSRGACRPTAAHRPRGRLRGRGPRHRHGRFPRGTREGVPHGKRGGACNPSCQAERGASRGFDEL